jgi:hypothetical protein
MNSPLFYQLKKWLTTLVISLVIIILGILSFKFNLIFDWTKNSKNSLSQASISMLELVKTPVLIQSYTVKTTLQSQIRKLIKPYQYYNSNIQLEFIDPALDPQAIRELGIQVEGELVVQFMNKTEHLTEISEQQISNTLLKLSKQSLRKVYFIVGHGERSAQKKANFDLSSLTDILKKQGYTIKESDILNLEMMVKPEDIVVLAGPRSQVFDGEVEILINLLEQGSHFLWLSDPLCLPRGEHSAKQVNSQDLVLQGSVSSDFNSLDTLSEYLGFEFSDGIIVDPATQQLKLKRPDFAIISEYMPRHPIGSKLTQTTLFPQALAIDPLGKTNDFKLEAFLMTSIDSWLETTPLEGTISYSNDLDSPGPLILGVTLQRELESTENTDNLHQQRIVIVGDGDFISNRYLANGGNTSLGLNIFNWLSAEEQLLAIPPKFYIDQKINLSKNKLILLGVFFFICLPLLLFFIGFFIHQKRK